MEANASNRLADNAIANGDRGAEAGAETTIGVLDPSTGEEIGRIPAGDAGAAAKAVAAAAEAQPEWAKTPAAERAAALKAATGRLRQHLDELAELQTRENGKPLADSRGGVEAGIATVEQYAELGPLHRGRSLAGSSEAVDLMVHEPLGVAALLVPWNDPLAIALGQLAACLVTGNTVVLKPSEKTPLSTQRALELMDLPEGVAVLLLGDARAGRPLVEHECVDVVLHTGSVETGREIAAICGRSLRKAVLELGGKDALVVDAGVEPSWAAEQAASGAFANAGQICTSVERIYVHEAVAGMFLEALVEQARSLKMGPGLDPESQIGPLIDENQRFKVDRHVRGAVEGGAEVLCGGEASGGPGFFYPPTVLCGVEEWMDVVQDESFGPLAPVAVVDSFEAGIAAANASRYGLAATVLTPSQENAQCALRALKAGTVKVNDVWGGAPGGAAEPRRHSGLGFGYGPELLDEVTTTKVAHVEPAPPR
ncbi:MAG TPA: aldehyde dehydrogenase family protein [Solirubrobacterales bacterium]|nr:aldehyde dehydrogenase family protein [Solirubrobacterales bacterium]